ncbi:MAG: beta-lactamase family protein [Parvularculaceae bacterium]|nr:beta-lactamase family protein [Parvularculaceae bacterium]
MITMRSHTLAALAMVAATAQACTTVPPIPQPRFEPRDEVALASGQTISSTQLGATLDAIQEQTGVSGYSATLINDGVVVFHHVSGLADVDTGVPVDETTTFEAASLSKPLFGAFVVHLASQGLLDLDTSLASYWPHPDLADDPRAELFTARMVLTHQTGLPNWRSDSPSGELTIGFEPGERYSYSGEGYEYLADVLMHLLETDDEGLDRIFRSWLLDPRSIEATSFVQSAETLDRKSEGYGKGQKLSSDVNYRVPEFGAAHSVHSEALSYAKAMIALMDGSALTPDASATFYGRQDTPLPADFPGREVGLVDWGLGFAIYETPAGRFYGHGGNNRGYTNFVAINPETQWGVVIFSNENQAAAFTEGVIAAATGLLPPQ